MELKRNEMELIGLAIDTQKKEKDYSKAFQTKGKSDVWKNYEKTSLGKVHKKVTLLGALEEVYRKAFDTKITSEKVIVEDGSIKSVAKELSNANRSLELKNVFYNYNNDRTLKEVSVKEVSFDTFKDYSQFFDKVFAVYGSNVSKIQIVNKANKEYQETSLRVIFTHKNNKIWSLDYPFINKDGFFNSGNNIYAFMFTIENMKEIISGENKELKLEHPYVWLSKQLLKAYTLDGDEILYTEEIFNKIIFGSRRENNYKLQMKLVSALRNAKENPWEEKNATPVVWFDKFSSAISKFSYTRNILIDSCYADLVKIGLIQGLDLLTGSTSTPAKRVKPASCWDIKRHGADLVLERVKDHTSIIEDYAGEFKCSFPAFVKTSAKRDNSCTIKDTVDFIEPQQYQRKFILK